MKIGFIVQNAYSGNSYLSKMFADALDEHEIFIFATEGAKHTDKSFWEGYNVFHSKSEGLDIEHTVLGKWIKEKNLDAIFLNECLDWNLISFLKDYELKVFGYIYYFTPNDVPYIKTYYDAILIPSEHVYENLIDLKNCHFVSWGIDTNLFKPCGKPEYDFFHSAGWGGIDFRKCTPEIIRAFHRLGRGTMLLHTQTAHFDTATKDRIKELRADGRLKVKVGTVDHPGLYHKGKVYVGPSKMEGLGMYIPEALACGLPVITNNQLPMTQFVEHEYNGIIIDSEEKEGVEGYSWKTFKINEDQLLEAMKDVLDGKYNLKKMSINARDFIVKNHSFDKVFKPRVKEIIQ